MMYEWHIRIVDAVASLDKEIYIFRRGPDGTLMWYPDGEEKVEYNATVKPSIRMDDAMFKLLVDAVGPHYKSPEKPYLEGKLEATEHHLFDLRVVLGLAKKL